MIENRQVTCCGTSYHIIQFCDAELGIFTSTGEMVAGWPETAALPAQAITILKQWEWAQIVHQFCRRSTGSARVSALTARGRW